MNELSNILQPTSQEIKKRHVAKNKKIRLYQKNTSKEKYKLLDRFLIQPIKKDLTFNELKTLLTSLGYQKIQGSRSRVKFYH
jgi:CHAT domain-containing protein